MLSHLKGNQGTLCKEVELLFQHAKENELKGFSHDTYETTDREHGRIEISRFTTTDKVEWFEDRQKREKLTSFGMVESQRHIDDKITCETHLYISSLSIDAKILAQASRGHLGVENDLHRCLDIGFREDDSRTRMGQAATNQMILCSISVALTYLSKTRASDFVYHNVFSFQQGVRPDRLPQSGRTTMNILFGIVSPRH
jgi:predicted transposase YbfD/YdcC